MPLMEKEIYNIDFKANPEGKVTSFPPPQELWERAFGKTNEGKTFSDFSIVIL